MNLFKDRPTPMYTMHYCMHEELIEEKARSIGKLTTQIFSVVMEASRRCTWIVLGASELAHSVCKHSNPSIVFSTCQLKILDLDLLAAGCGRSTLGGCGTKWIRQQSIRFAVIIMGCHRLWNCSGRLAFLGRTETFVHGWHEVRTQRKPPTRVSNR